MSYNTATQLAALNRFAASFPNDPAEYARQFLRVKLTPDQRGICDALVKHRKVLVPAANEVGKTFLASCLASFFHDNFVPGRCLTTAPNMKQVRDLLWKEIRMRRGPRGGFPGPKACRLEGHGPNHFAVGYTAKDATGFQGHHCENMFIVFDEGAGLDKEFWDAADTMAGNSENSYQLVIFNPTSINIEPYRQQRNRNAGWKVRRLSAANHPNVLAELRGEPPPIPGAIGLTKFTRLLKQWSSPIPELLNPNTDIEWPPGSGEFWRMGPVAQARLFGRYPTGAVNTVWGEGLVEFVTNNIVLMDSDWRVQVGCDVAHYGDDFSSVHVRKGMCSVEHEEYNGVDGAFLAGKMKQFAAKWSRGDAKRVPCLIDVTGGGGWKVFEHQEDFNFVPINSSEIPKVVNFVHNCKNVRTELWFLAAELAKTGNIDVSRLNPEVWEEISEQLMGVEYEVLGTGQVMIEDKKKTKKRCERSPDSADAFNLAYYFYQDPDERVIGRV